jgi:hypothetical protein
VSVDLLRQPVFAVMRRPADRKVPVSMLGGIPVLEDASRIGAPIGLELLALLELLLGR